MVIGWIIFACSRGYGGNSTRLRNIQELIKYCGIITQALLTDSYRGKASPTTRSVNLLRLPYSLRLPERLLRSNQEAILLHDVRAVHNLLWCPCHMLWFGFCNICYIGSLFLEFGKMFLFS